MSLRAMSADSHMDLIYLPPDTFTSRMASTWRDRAPKVVERDGRKVWVSGDAVLGPWGVYGPGRDRWTARPHPGRRRLRLRHADAALESRRAAPGSGARRRRGRDHLRHHRDLARVVHAQRHRRSRDLGRGVPCVQRLHRRLQSIPARTLLRPRLSAESRRERGGRRGASLRRARAAWRRLRSVGLEAPGVASGMGASVDGRGGDRSRRSRFTSSRAAPRPSATPSRASRARRPPAPGPWSRRFRWTRSAPR